MFDVKTETMSAENVNNSAVSKEQTEEKQNATTEPEKITPLPVQTINGFNTEEFLARVNMNEKINYLLRSPTKTPNGTRQRSVFTSITSVSDNFDIFLTHIIQKKIQIL